MSRHLPRYALLLLAILVMSHFLPQGYDKIFGQAKGQPLLFFSPISKSFIYRESLGGHQFNYLDDQGKRYDRAGFEAQLPFLYYKNLERQGLLPITIAGLRYDQKTIKQQRQGFEIKNRHLNGHSPQIPLYPLFNNDPQVTMMPFPEDVFRFSKQGMEFINADANKVDQELTSTFTAALSRAGFVFPATVIGGKTTNLKPFDEGFFIRDTAGHVFHVKRQLDKPLVVKTPIPAELAIRDIIVSENRRKEFYGLLISEQGGLYLLTYDNYRLIQLPVNGFNPEHSDLKILINPLYRTVIVSQPKQVTATAMDRHYQKLGHFTVQRRPGLSPALQKSADLLFPFRLQLSRSERGQAEPALQAGSSLSLIGLALALLASLLIYQRQGRLRQQAVGDLLLVACTGLYGLIAITFIRLPE